MLIIFWCVYAKPTMSKNFLVDLISPVKIAGRVLTVSNDDAKKTYANAEKAHIFLNQQVEIFFL